MPNHVGVPQGAAVQRHACWGPVFLAAISEGMHVRDASKAAGVHGTMPYKRRRDDPAFAMAWKEAAITGSELLEEEAIRRAYHVRPVYHQGIEVGQIREYSDALLIRLLQAHPEFRDIESSRLHRGRRHLKVLPIRN